MALIEHLDSDGWAESLSHFFGSAVKLLKEDRFRFAGSSIDDIKSWLTAGGVSRLKHHLNVQMAELHYPDDKQVAVQQRLDQLVQSHRLELLDLLALDVIPLNWQNLLDICGWSQTDVAVLARRTGDGDHPLVEWLAAQGYSQDAISIFHRLIGHTTTDD
jgi:hypothetical protein